MPYWMFRDEDITCCDECPCLDLGWRYMSDKTHCECGVLEREVTGIKRGRPDWCPLVRIEDCVADSIPELERKICKARNENAAKHGTQHREYQQDMSGVAMKKEGYMAIQQAIEALGHDMADDLKDEAAVVLNAAQKWAVIEWMEESGFADGYSFLNVMTNFTDYENAYRRVLQK